MTLSDNHFPTPITSIKTIVIKVTDPQGLLNPKTQDSTNAQIVETKIKTAFEVKKIKKQQKEKGSAFIKSIDNFGRVTVQFN